MVDWSHTTVGQRLDWLAKYLKVSPRQLSLQAGASKSHASNLIAGRATEGMQGGTAKKYADFWKCSVQWLEHGEGQPFAVGSVLSVPEIEAGEATEPGRWRRYAARYWQFRIEATFAKSRGVPDPVLDAAADRLGALHDENGPSEEEARAAIERYEGRTQPQAEEPPGREAIAGDFIVQQQTIKKRGKNA